MSLPKDLSELVKEGVISKETAEKIGGYYKGKKGNTGDRLFVAFGILGAILVGLGIILMVAHNWDEIPRGIKTLLAFLPLIGGQLLCIFSLWKKPESKAWRESSAAFLFFAVGACMALISQIYHLPGDMERFLLAWMALCLPLIYLMRSSTASLLYILGITWYACEIGYGNWHGPVPYLYWPLLLAALPNYYSLLKERAENSFAVFHHWLVPLSLTITLLTVADRHEDLLFVAYLSLFGCFYLLGQGDFFRGRKLSHNGYRILGSIGTMAMLFFLTLEGFWDSLANTSFKSALSSPEFAAAAILSLLGIFLLYRGQKDKKSKEIKPISAVFLLFIPIFLLGLYEPVGAAVMNLFIFGIGLLVILEGARKERLGQLNYGLLMIMALIILRFFDTDLEFVFKGLLFVAVGIGFFAANYWMLKKRKSHD